MSEGLTTYDFVQQVYYAQEKVILDFWPSDDKFKEVLFEANLLLQEMQSQEDWNWLRERLVLGDCESHPNEIPEFRLPSWVYKNSTLHNDGIKLYRKMPHLHHHHCHHHPDFGSYNVKDFIDVPFASVGDNQKRKERLYDEIGQIHNVDRRLRAVRVGDVITFNRTLTPWESHRIAVMDVQRRIEQFHICDRDCHLITSVEFKDHDGNWRSRDLDRPVCSKDADLEFKKERDGKHLIAVHPHRHLEIIPDPNYVVMATAARHAEGSPPAQARIAGLNDTAQRILSAMRQNDASATDADYVDWDIPGYVEIV